MNVVFPCCANWETFLAETKMFLNKIMFVSATNVARAGKRGNICVGNNMSSFSRALILRVKPNPDVFTPGTFFSY